MNCSVNRMIEFWGGWYVFLMNIYLYDHVFRAVAIGRKKGRKKKKYGCFSRHLLGYIVFRELACFAVMPNKFMGLKDRFVEKRRWFISLWIVDLRYGFIPTEVDMTLKMS